MKQAWEHAETLDVQRWDLSCQNHAAHLEYGRTRLNLFVKDHSRVEIHLLLYLEV